MARTVPQQRLVRRICLLRIAAVFSMCNRYVDGLAALGLREANIYRVRGRNCGAWIFSGDRNRIGAGVRLMDVPLHVIWTR